VTQAWKAWLARAVDAREEERRALFGSAWLLFFVLASYYMVRAVREEIGIRQGLENLAELWQWTAIFSLAAHPVIGLAVARLPRRIFVPWAFRGALAAVLCFYAGLTRTAGPEDAPPPETWLFFARAFYVALSVWVMLATSLFWSLMADLWRPEQGKRLFGFISAGGTLGAAAGAGLTMVVAKWVPLPPVVMLIPCAVLLEVGAQIARRLVRLADQTAAPRDRAAVGGSSFAGFAEVVRSPYLLAGGAFVLLITLGNSFLYQHQGQILRDAFPDDGETRTSILAGIDFATNLVTFATQGWLTARWLKRFGVGRTLAAMPLLSVAGFLLLGLWPAVVIVVAFQVTRRALHFALTRPGRALLFTVLPRSERYKAQNFLDVVLFRGGDVASAQVYDALADPEEGLGWGVRATAFLAAPACLLLAAIGLHLGRRFDARAAEQRA
jgi:AAA family ATP:ADP antiporter